MMTSFHDSIQRPPRLKSLSLGNRRTSISASNAQLVSPCNKGENVSFRNIKCATPVNTEQLSSPSNGHLPVSPRNMPLLSPKNVEQHVSHVKRQLSTSNRTMPLLSPCNKQNQSPGATQTASTTPVSSFSSRRLFNNLQVSTTNRQFPIKYSGQLLSPNNIKHSALFGDHQGYSQDQPTAEVTRARQLYTVDQECQALPIPEHQNQLPGTWLPSSVGSGQNGWSLSPALRHITPTTGSVNDMYSQSEARVTPIPSSKARHQTEQSYQDASQFIHNIDLSQQSDYTILPNQTLNTSESRNLVMSSNFHNDGAVLEQNLQINCRQKSNDLPGGAPSPPGVPNMEPATENSMTECSSSSIVTGGNIIAGQWSVSGQHRSPRYVSGSEDVIVTKVTGTGSRHDQTSTIQDPIHQEQHVSGQPQYNITSTATQSGPPGQHTLSGPLGHQAQSRPLLGQQTSSLQEHMDQLDVPQLPSAELLQIMMANNSPSKFVVMKMSGSDKYIILSPEKSSTSEMVYKPMGSMKLPPGKYSLHTMNGHPLPAASDKGQTTQQKNDGTFPCEVAQKASSKTGGKISKKKCSIKTSSTKEKKNSKKEKQGKQQPNTVAGTKKAKNKFEKKKNKVEKKKNPVHDKKPTAQDKKPKSKPKKKKDPKDPNSKVKKNKSRSKAVVKKTEEKKEETKCRILTPCQKFCRTVLISHNKAGRTTHTISNPVIFFTGGQFFMNSHDTPEVEHPVYLLTSGDNDHILAIMSEAFSPGQYLLSSKRPVTCHDKFISSDLHDKDLKNQPPQFHLYQAVLSPYHFSVSSPMKGHKVILLSQYQDVPYDTPSREGSMLLEDPALGASSNLISSVVDTWDQSYDVTTLVPCTHPLYDVMNEMLKKKIDEQPKMCKFKLRIQLFDSRRKKRQKKESDERETIPNVCC